MDICFQLSEGFSYWFPLWLYYFIFPQIIDLGTFFSPLHVPASNCVWWFLLFRPVSTRIRYASMWLLVCPVPISQLGCLFCCCCCVSEVCGCCNIEHHSFMFCITCKYFLTFCWLPAHFVDCFYYSVGAS